MSLASLALLPTFWLPTIWIVDADNGPGSHFTDLPAAVAAAQSGDSILVRSGSYSAFDVVGKVLTIRGAGQQLTVVDQAGPVAAFVRIGPTLQGGAVSLAGMSLLPPAPTQGSCPGIQIEPGAVAVLTDCKVEGPDWPGVLTVMPFEATGASVAGRLHASRCTFAGGSAPNSGGIAGDGVVVVGSGSFAASACLCRGGDIGSVFVGSVLAGRGLFVDGGRATLHDTTCTGGNSGNALLPAGSGPGDGTRVVNGGFVRHAGSSTSTAGYPIAALQPYSVAGVRTDALSSAVLHAPAQALPGSASGSAIIGNVLADVELPRIQLTGTTSQAGELLASQPVTIAVDAPLPNAPMVLLADIDTDYSTLLAPLVLGELLVPLGTPAQFFLLDGAGHWQLSFTPATATPLALGMPVFLQAGVFDGMQVRVSPAASRIFFH